MTSLPLAGPWIYQLDRENRGVAQRWFSHAFTGATIMLPGTLPGHGIGDRVGLDTPWTGGIFDQSFFNSPDYAPYREPDNFKVPFWLQPETYYAGVAWFQREIEIPADWAGRRLVLELERPHWLTRVWLDEREISEQDALSTPHRHELGTKVTPGLHRLTLRVDNSRLAVNIGDNSHSISDHTQGNWNGVAGRLALHATDTIWIDELDVFPDVAARAITVRGRLAGAVPVGEWTTRPTDGHTVVRQHDAAAFAIGLDNGDVEGTTAEVEDEGFLAFGGGPGIGQCGGIGLGQKCELGNIGEVAGFGHTGDGCFVPLGMVGVVDRSANDHAGDRFVRDCFDAIDDLAEYDGNEVFDGIAFAEDVGIGEFDVT
jgi:hypothetical protein